MYGQSNSIITSDLSDLEMSMSGSLTFWKHISRKGTELGRILVLATIKKPYMGSPMTLSQMALTDLESSKSSYSDFKAL